MSHDRVVDTYAERKRRNDVSKSWAKRDGAAWEQVEDDLLLEEWIYKSPSERDEETVSRVLERTIEACRVRCEHIRRKLGISVVAYKETETTTTTTTTTRYVGALDDPDDCWWSPDYYTGG